MHKWKKGAVAILTGIFIGALTTADDVSFASTSAPQNQDVVADLKKLDATIGRPAIDAHVDRVWHAIPGLNGWHIDLQRSVEATQKAHDGRYHLVWSELPPSTRLADLPPEPIYRGPGEEKSVSLMFNVSWGEAYLAPILQTLHQHRVHATFFIDGAFAAKHPDLVKQIQADGHAIGTHGTGHPDFRQLSDAQLSSQIVQSNHQLETMLNKPVDLLAPPAGAYDERTVKMARDSHMYTVLWTVDTIDWKKPEPQAIVERVMGKVEPGAFVLMHPTEPTAKALPKLIEQLRDGGYHLKTVEAVVREEASVTPPTTLSKNG